MTQENQKNDHLYWLRNGQSGKALATGSLVSALVLSLYDRAAAGISVVIWLLIAAGAFLLVDRPRRRRDREQTPGV